jgi:hypothetical protein
LISNMHNISKIRAAPAAASQCPQPPPRRPPATPDPRAMAQQRQASGHHLPHLSSRRDTKQIFLANFSQAVSAFKIRHRLAQCAAAM